MSKREWIRPRGVVQAFQANEYVGACWVFQCEVPTGTIYIDANRDHKISTDWSIIIGTYVTSPDYSLESNSIYLKKDTTKHVYLSDNAKPETYPAYLSMDASGEPEYHVWVENTQNGCTSQTRVHVSKSGLVPDERPNHS